MSAWHLRHYHLPHLESLLTARIALIPKKIPCRYIVELFFEHFETWLIETGKEKHYVDKQPTVVLERSNAKVGETVHKTTTDLCTPLFWCLKTMVRKISNIHVENVEEGGGK